MQSYVTDASLALVALPIISAILLAGIATIIRHTPPQGWRALKPSIGQWVACVGSAGFASLIFWVWAFVGSSRSDGAFQMNTAWWLALAFGLSGFIVGAQILMIARSQMSWRGNKLLIGSGKEFSLEEIASVEPSLNRRRLCFNDGTAVFVNMEASGSSELLQRIYRIKGMSDYLEPPEH